MLLKQYFLFSLTPNWIRIFIHYFNNNKHILGKFLKAYSTFARNVLPLQKLQAVHTNSVSDSICNINYISKYWATGSVLFRHGWWLPPSQVLNLPIRQKYYYYIHTIVNSVKIQHSADYLGRTQFGYAKIRIRVLYTVHWL